MRKAFFLFAVLTALITAGCGDKENQSGDNAARFVFDSAASLSSQLPDYLREFQRVVDAGGKNYPRMEGSVQLHSPFKNASDSTSSPGGRVFDPSKDMKVGNAPSVYGAFQPGAPMCYFPCVQFGIPGICSNCLASGCNVNPFDWACGNSNMCDPDLCGGANLVGLAPPRF